MAVVNDDWLRAQCSVLGSALIEPDLVPKVIAETSERDYAGPCQTVFKTIRKLFLSGAAVDVVSVAGALGSDYRDYLVQLMDVTPTAANLDHYIALCRDQARVSAIRDIAQKMTGLDSLSEIRKLLDDANGMMVDKPSLKITTMDMAMKSFMDRHTREAHYLSWPVAELNDRIYAELGDLIIIGGYPSTGKSAWALQCAWHWAREYKVGFFSLETSSEKLFDRQMSAVANLTMDDIKRNTIDQSGWERVCAMSTDIISQRLELIPAAGMTPADVKAVTVMRGYQIILVDYLQLLQGSGDNRTAQVTATSIALHTMAQSLGVTVIALSQLARQGQQQKNQPPDMSSLRESGQIEQDADLIMMLSLQDKDKPDGNRELRIRKNKEGTCPNILLAFDGKHQTFSKAARTGDTVAQLKAMARGTKTARRELQPTSDQMTMLPPDTPVPF